VLSAVSESARSPSNKLNLNKTKDRDHFMLWKMLFMRVKPRMSWQKTSTKSICTAWRFKGVWFAPEQVIWNLTLDQIELLTCRISAKQLVPALRVVQPIFWSQQVQTESYLNKAIYPADKGIRPTSELVPISSPFKKKCKARWQSYQFIIFTQIIFFLNLWATVSGARMPNASWW